MKGLDLTGQTFGRLTVVERVSTCKYGIIWKCICTCGNTKNAISQHLKAGCTSSCGCLRMTRKGSNVVKIKHVQSEYYAWSGIRERCYNKKNKGYPNYGGRGISVCDRWLNSFQNFLEDVGRKPGPTYSLDRHPNNNGNYEPGNVRWATPKEQATNRRSNRIITWNGQSKNMKAWSEELGIKYYHLQYRINKGESMDTISSNHLILEQN